MKGIALALTRRRVLTGLLAVLALPRVGLRAAPTGNGFHIIDGWILTDADLAALAQHDP